MLLDMDSESWSEPIVDLTIMEEIHKLHDNYGFRSEVQKTMSLTFYL